MIGTFVTLATTVSKSMTCETKSHIQPSLYISDVTLCADAGHTVVGLHVRDLSYGTVSNMAGLFGRWRASISFLRSGTGGV